MKPLPTLALSLSLLLPCLLPAQDITPTTTEPTISVSGEAEIKVAPDLIDLRLGIEVRNKEFPAAKEENDKRVDAVLKALKDAGLEDKDVKTDWIEVSPSYDYNSSRVIPEYFSVQKSIQCTIRDVTKFEKTLSTALAAGATHVLGIDFRTSKLREYRDQARVNALRAAREKADLLAGEVGMKRGKVKTLSEIQGGGSWNWYSNYWGRSYGNQLTQNSIQNVSGGTVQDGLAPGQISISARINATFILE